MKKTLILALTLAAVVSAYAQTERVIGVSYNMAFSHGDLNEFISKPGFRSFNIDYREVVMDGLGVGIDIGWNVFYKEMPDDAVYQYNDNIDYSGKQFRYFNTLPVIATADYFFMTDKKVRPFVGFGLGMMYNEARVDMGVYTFTRDAFQFAIKPEAGLMYEVNDGLGLSLNAKYYYSVKGGDLPSQGYFTVGIGINYLK